MPIFRFQVAAAADTVLPRDRIINTLWFNDRGPDTDLHNLCQDLANIFGTFYYNGPTREIDVRAYDDADTPGPPSDRFTLNTGAAPVSGSPREVALCLSFYAGQNSARHRGRIYLPAFELGALGLRPTNAQMDKVLNLGDQFSGLGGADVDWIVKSRKAGGGGTVTNTWVDDEWDTQRRRGLRSTTRRTDTVSG